MANILAQVRDWLRAGYPEGFPQEDYVALLGLLARRLTPQEVETVARSLHAEGQFNATNDQIRDMIEQTALTPPNEQDVRRVAGRLAQGGWPLAGFDAE